jgi:hypothetical protein
MPHPFPLAPQVSARICDYYFFHGLIKDLDISLCEFGFALKQKTTHV